jgi:hypothetical protein
MLDVLLIASDRQPLTQGRVRLVNRGGFRGEVHMHPLQSGAGTRGGRRYSSRIVLRIVMDFQNLMNDCKAFLVHEVVAA